MTALTSASTLPKLTWRLGVLALLGYAFLITVVRTVQLPLGYGQVHWLLDYRFGFVKRAVPGAVLNAFGLHETLSTSFMAVIASSVFFLGALSLGLLVIAWRIVVRNDYSLTSVFLAILLVTSPYVLYAGLLIGYFDNLIHAAAIGLIALVLMRRFTWVALLQLPLMFIHEMYLIVGFPALLLALWLTTRDEPMPARWQPWAIIVPPILSFLLIFFWSDVAGDIQTQFEAWDAVVAEFTYVREDYRGSAPALIIFGFSDYLAEQAAGVPFRLTEFPVGVMFVCLVALFAIWRGTQKRYRVPLQVGVALVTVFPAGMLFIAWDMERIWTYCAFHALLLVWILSERGDIRLDDTLDLTLFYVIGVLIAFAHPPTLMDDTVDRYAADGALMFTIYSPLIISFLYFKPTRNLITNIFMGTRRPTAKSKLLAGD